LLLGIISRYDQAFHISDRPLANCRPILNTCRLVCAFCFLPRQNIYPKIKQSA
jgi:hypothetical protein